MTYNICFDLGLWVRNLSFAAIIHQSPAHCILLGILVLRFQCFYCTIPVARVSSLFLVFVCLTFWMRQSRTRVTPAAFCLFPVAPVILSFGTSSCDT
jgi:hypothetical protein